jgi:hypothetical protein
MAEGCRVTVVEFDRDRHRRAKVRLLERQVDHLEQQRKRVERILALALECATKNAACGPLDLLKVLEELDRERTRPRRELSHAEWLDLLRPLPCELERA